MFTSVPGGGQIGHLYQFVTVLGVFVAVASLYSCSVITAQDERRVREFAAPLFREDATDKEQQHWLNYHAQALKNAQTAFDFLIYSAAAGFGVAIAGCIGWYYKVQRFDDEKRRLENEKLKRDTELNSNSAAPAG